MDTRDQLQMLATRLFAAHGYDAVGVQEIVEAAGVSKPTLYHHFGSKLGLLEAILETRLGSFLARVDAATRYDHDLTATLLAVLSAQLDFADEDPDTCRLMLTLSVSPPEHETHAPAARYRDRMIARLEALFVAAAADHGNMRGRQSRYGRSFLALVESTAAWRLSGGPSPDARARFDIIHQFSHGLYS